MLCNPSGGCLWCTFLACCQNTAGEVMAMPFTWQNPRLTRNLSCSSLSTALPGGRSESAIDLRAAYLRPFVDQSSCQSQVKRPRIGGSESPLGCENTSILAHRMAESELPENSKYDPWRTNRPRRNKGLCTRHPSVHYVQSQARHSGRND